MEIRTSDAVDKIMPALLAAHRDMSGGAVEKSQTNSFEKYKYAQLADYYLASHKALVENDLFVLESAPDIVDLPDRVTNKGKAAYAVRVRVTMRIYHSSGQWVEGSGWGEGVHHQDKAVYIATTGARKYLMAMMCHLVTTDDPERYEADLSGPPADVQKAADALGMDAAEQQATPDKKKMAKCNKELLAAENLVALSLVVKKWEKVAIPEGWANELSILQARAEFFYKVEKAEDVDALHIVASEYQDSANTGHWKKDYNDRVKGKEAELKKEGNNE